MHTHLLPMLASVLLLVAASISYSQDGLKPPAHRPESSPVFRADVDRAGTHQYTNYREPVVVRTVSGRLIIAVHAGNKRGWPERSGQDLVVRYSDDQGKSWSPLIVAAEHGYYSVQSHGMVYDAKNNRLTALYVTYNWDYAAVKGRGYAATAPLYEQMHKEGKAAMSAYLVASDDEGKSWSKPRDITEMVGGDAHFGSSEGRQLTVGEHAGRLILAGGDDRTIDAKGKVIRKKAGVWISDDHGETWTFHEIRAPEAITSVRNISCEGRVSELPDATLIYNMRSRHSGRQIAFSRDGGQSWTETVTAKELIAAQCNGSMITVTDKAGQLTETLVCSLPRGKGRANGVVYISKDGGTTWPHYKPIVPAAFAYSALVQLDTKNIGLFYETNHHQDIRFIALPLEQLTSTIGSQ